MSYVRPRHSVAAPFSASPTPQDHRRARLPIDAAAITLLYQHGQLCLAEDKYGEIVSHSFDVIADTLKMIVMRRHWRAPDEDAVASASPPSSTALRRRIRSMPQLLSDSTEFLPSAIVLCRALIAIGRFEQVRAGY